MITHRAAWVLPISGSPIRNGWVSVERDRIVGVGADDTAPCPDVAILPGLVNAHTHLELTWMRNQVPPAESMPAWAERLMALRRTVGHEPSEPIHEAVVEARAAGTTLVGDITNTFAAYEALLDSDLSAAIFRELLGFNAADPGRLVADAAAQIETLTPVAWLRPSIVPHAPYSVSPDLLRAIAAAAGERPISVHLGESAEEVQFLRDGSGSWRDLLVKLRVWNDRWSAPEVGPVEYLERCGLLNERLIAVHCVQLTDRELEQLARAQATVVTCPRSNEWTGAGTPPLERFYASGVRVAVGTDSLASVDDLNVFQELAAMHRIAPNVPARALLESATRIGAEALGFGAELGTLEPGKRAELIAVTVPHDVDDVEAYLVSGIQPSDIAWLPNA